MLIVGVTTSAVGRVRHAGHADPAPGPGDLTHGPHLAGVLKTVVIKSRQTLIRSHSLPSRAPIDELHQAVDYGGGVGADDGLAAGRGPRPLAALDTLPRVVSRENEPLVADDDDGRAVSE